MKENIIQQKSFAFAIRIIKAYNYLASEKKEYVLSKQLIRSGTSIGANVEEAIGGQSKKDLSQKFLSHIRRPEKPNIGFACWKQQIF